MMRETTPTPSNGIRIDFYHFYPVITQYLEKVMCYAKRDIRSNHIANITNIVFDWLLNRVPNFTVTPCPWSWRLYRYFDKDEAIEIFDDLFLDFIDFIREKGIDGKKHYTANRGKQCRYTCSQTDKVTPNFQ